MKYYGGNVAPSPDYHGDTYTHHENAWRFRDVLNAPKLAEPEYVMPPELVEELTDPPQLVIPPLLDLIEQTPDAWAWLRGQMTAASNVGDSEGKPAGKPGSKPPFRVAFMSAADREVAALAYWLQQLNIEPESPAYRVNGRIAGTYSAQFKVVTELTELLWYAVRDYEMHGHSIFEDFEDILTHDRFGIWSVRSLHYMLWPNLSHLFDEEEAVPEREDRAEEPDQPEESLF